MNGERWLVACVVGLLMAVWFDSAVRLHARDLRARGSVASVILSDER